MELRAGSAERLRAWSREFGVRSWVLGIGVESQRNKRNPTQELRAGSMERGAGDAEQSAKGEGLSAESRERGAKR